MRFHLLYGRGRSATPLVLLFCVLAGCEKRVAVSGKVVENGQPVAAAELRWAHSTKPDVFVSGVTGADGAYILDAGGRKDIPVGKYQVTVTWWRTRDGRPLPPGEPGTALKDTAAARQFTATVEVEVKAGSAMLDVDVTGKAAPVEGGS